jgi:hypothetical protein
MSAVPFKANAARRHRTQAAARVTNWAEYDASLRQRGSLTVWLLSGFGVVGARVPRGA